MTHSQVLRPKFTHRLGIWPRTHFFCMFRTKTRPTCIFDLEKKLGDPPIGGDGVSSLKAEIH